MQSMPHWPPGMPPHPDTLGTRPPPLLQPAISNLGRNLKTGSNRPFVYTNFIKRIWGMLGDSCKCILGSRCVFLRVYTSTIPLSKCLNTFHTCVHVLFCVVVQLVYASLLQTPTGLVG
ncbi:hypothetical protein CY35_14G013500 [Sphagnum magellanicum]|nr:hypothetical protein CY35_14G013500 [Sphagnum magellanicum]